jgi:Anti-sigma-K factor rskA, C-terminal
MDHAEAHEYIADLALEPERLAGLAASTSAADIALREHASRCPRCATELAAWQALQHGAAQALGNAAPADLERIAAPDDLRRAVLTGARSRRALGMPRLGLPRRLSARLTAVALAVALVAGGAIVMADQAAHLNASDASRRALAGALQTTTQVLADPAHQATALTAADGSANGTVAWNQHDLVVLATGLAAPVEGQVYRCWVTGPGGETPVGQMEFVDGQAFWVGALDGWASVDLQNAYSFAVTLETSTGGASPAGPVVLEGALGG